MGTVISAVVEYVIFWEKKSRYSALQSQLSHRSFWFLLLITGSSHTYIVGTDWKLFQTLYNMWKTWWLDIRLTRISVVSRLETIKVSLRVGEPFSLWCYMTRAAVISIRYASVMKVGLSCPFVYDGSYAPRQHRATYYFILTAKTASEGVWLF